jgi:hypothetical protein
MSAKTAAQPAAVETDGSRSELRDIQLLKVVTRGRPFFLFLPAA